MPQLLSDDELPTERQIEIFVAICSLHCALTVSVVIITVFVIFRVSLKSMRQYRYYLVNQMLWAAFNDAFMSMFSPMLLLPVPCFSCLDMADQPVARVLSVLFIFTISGRIVAQGAQFVYRFFQSLPPDSAWNRVRWDLAPTWKIAFGFLMSVVIGAAVMFVPLIPGLRDHNTHRAILIRADPSMKRIFDRFPSTTCFSTRLDVSPTMVLCGLAVLLALLAAFAYVGGVMYMNIRQNQRATRRIQLMLFRSLIAQSMATLALLAIPGLVGSVGPLWGLRGIPKLSLLIVSILLMHTQVDCLMILYFIKPYRLFLFDGFDKARSMVFARSSVRAPASEASSIFVKYM